MEHSALCHTGPGDHVVVLDLHEILEIVTGKEFDTLEAPLVDDNKLAFPRVGAQRDPRTGKFFVTAFAVVNRRLVDAIVVRRGKPEVDLEISGEHRVGPRFEDIEDRRMILVDIDRVDERFVGLVTETVRHDNPVCAVAKRREFEIENAAVDGDRFLVTVIELDPCFVEDIV